MEGKLGQVMGLGEWLVIYLENDIENMIPVAPSTDTNGFYVDEPVTFDIVDNYAVITSTITTTTTTMEP